ncbi:sensor histidine kinase [Niastella populi]|uniref:histidine kinase n=1 Tax=Niastella populi TaxID=550983 RepID=A0A1V9EKC5_9BACT|nr:ATP-binding protein [Niastella populi]OQP46598.1 two-component sensor histidine kinase [Niastella populi]
MSSAKNLSPRQLAAFTAGILAVPIALGIFALTLNWKAGLGSLVAIFAGGYWLILVTMERFIYRKIKLIYKLIYQTKATKKEEMYFKYILPQKSIDEVRADVEEWGERRNREIEMLQQNEAYRKEFLQNLAHEFKTPIFAIQGYVDTLLDGVNEEAIRKRFLENTAKNVDRLVNLMNDLDEISKLERGEQLLAKQNFIIQDLIREVYDSLSIKTQGKNIRTIIKKGCEAPITVFADKEKIKQVLINLVENATKYGKQNGNIVASIYDTDDQHVLVEISDDGIGIEEEHLPRIFERFYRTDTARSRDKGGTGLGLAICKHIIEAHGQSIHVRSTPDVGTTIGFTVEAKRD